MRFMVAGSIPMVTAATRLLPRLPRLWWCSVSKSVVQNRYWYLSKLGL